MVAGAAAHAGAAGRARTKAVAAAAAITYLNSGGGNRIGAVIANGENVIRVPARSGRQHEQTLLRAIATSPRAPLGVRGDLSVAIDALRRPERRRGMAVIISDFLGPITWMRPLRAIAARHEVLGVEVLDPRDVELPDVGDVILQDAESGITREFTIDAQLRDDFARPAAAHRAEVARTLRRGGAPLMTLRTDRDWIADIVRFVASRRRGALALQGGLARRRRGTAADAAGSELRRRNQPSGERGDPAAPQGVLRRAQAGEAAKR